MTILGRISGQASFGAIYAERGLINFWPTVSADRNESEDSWIPTIGMV